MRRSQTTEQVAGGLPKEKMDSFSSEPPQASTPPPVSDKNPILDLLAEFKISNCGVVALDLNFAEDDAAQRGFNVPTSTSSDDTTQNQFCVQNAALLFDTEILAKEKKRKKLARKKAKQKKKELERRQTAESML